MDLRQLLDHPACYSAWQAPFAQQKIAPFLNANDVAQISRILEIGCGPGTNATLFNHADYIGIDLNRRYIDSANSKYDGTFIHGDATTFELDSSESFDAVLINSLLHHLDDEAVDATLLRAAKALCPGGHFHCCDLVLPKHRSVARWLARLDRGDYPRDLARWDSMLSGHFQTELFQPYSVGFCGLTCWQMFYFRGRTHE